MKKPGETWAFYICRALEQWINRALAHCDNAVYCSIGLLSAPAISRASEDWTRKRRVHPPMRSLLFYCVSLQDLTPALWARAVGPDAPTASISLLGGPKGADKGPQGLLGFWC